MNGSTVDPPRRPRGPYASGAGSRAVILEATRLQPGISRSGLARVTGLAWQTVRHHVSAMVERGELQALAMGRRTLFGVAGGDSRVVVLMRLVRTEPTMGRTLRTLNSKGPASVAVLTNRLGASRKTVRRCVAALVTAGCAEVIAGRSPKFELRSIPLAMRSTLAESPGPHPEHGRGVP